MGTPHGVALASSVSVHVQRGSSLMVTGRNATGKTSFVRVLSGLWNLEAGQIIRPSSDATKIGKLPTLSDVFVVPQQIHMVLGTLADQITYPTVIKKGDRTQQINA